jgi:erythromycin esterase
VLVGFSTYEGSVIAGSEWGVPARRMRVPAARFGSWDEVLHRVQPADKLLIFDPELKLAELLEERGQRAIGVVYRPQYEAYGNYVPTVLPKRYDALLSLDHSRAVHPLHVPAIVDQDLPETYPTGL